MTYQHNIPIINSGPKYTIVGIITNDNEMTLKLLWAGDDEQESIRKLITFNVQGYEVTRYIKDEKESSKINIHYKF
jgi:hypothetical protein